MGSKKQKGYSFNVNSNYLICMHSILLHKVQVNCCACMLAACFCSARRGATTFELVVTPVNNKGLNDEAVKYPTTTIFSMFRVCVKSYIKRL